MNCLLGRKKRETMSKTVSLILVLDCPVNNCLEKIIQNVML